MKRLGLGLMLAWLSAAAPGVALTLDTLPNYQDAGMRLYVSGTQKLQERDYVGAADDLRQAVRARPDMAEAFHNLGFALEKTGDMKTAASAYERALALNPNYASALNNLGFLLATLEADAQRAIQLCQRAVELEPDSANFRDSLGWDTNFFKSYFNLGLCEFTRKNYAEAGRNFITALKLNPGYIRAYIPLAECYERTGQNNKAINVYQQALTKTPEGSPVKRHVERKLKQLNNNSRSYYFANVKSIQGSSKLNEFLRRKGKGSRLGDYDAKAEAMESSTSFTPVSATPGADTLSVSTMGSDVDFGTSAMASRAPMASRVVAAPAPRQSVPMRTGELSVSQERSLEKRYALCQSYLDRGLVNEAASELEKIVVVAGDSGIGRQARSLLLKARKELDEKNVESARTHLEMGKDFFRAGKYDMAENEFRKSLELYPENAEAIKDLALLHYNQGRLKDAYEECKRAIALDRGLKEAYIVLGSLYSKKGRVDDAVRTLKRVREVSMKRDAVDDLAERMIASLTAGS
ncbi:MAG: Cellulose synthase operon protein C precursor [bacterium ADurb.Bin374]|nr:MAG: Cellulose synthase operon protein C precursor [bacterium ADurb.Bin374]